VAERDGATRRESSGALEPAAECCPGAGGPSLGWDGNVVYSGNDAAILADQAGQRRIGPIEVVKSKLEPFAAAFRYGVQRSTLN